jgi:prohibitin 2
MSRPPVDEYVQRARLLVRQNRGRFFGGGGRGPPGGGLALLGLVAVAGGGVLLQNALFNVDGGHRAIKYRRISGVSKEIYSEGWSAASEVIRLRILTDASCTGTHIKIPWFETEIDYDVRARPRNVSSLTGTLISLVACFPGLRFKRSRRSTGRSDKTTTRESCPVSLMRC